MRYTAIVSFAASWALLSQSPAAYAAPVPSQIDSVGERGWVGYGNKFAEPPDTNTTSQSEVQNLVDVLINALQPLQAQNTPPDSNITV